MKSKGRVGGKWQDCPGRQVKTAIQEEGKVICVTIIAAKKIWGWWLKKMLCNNLALLSFDYK